jgi:hypothetical protein
MDVEFSNDQGRDELMKLASRWHDAYGENHVEAAVTHGAQGAEGLSRHTKPAPVHGAAESPEPEALHPVPEMWSAPESPYPPLTRPGSPAPLSDEVFASPSGRAMSAAPRTPVKE